MQMSLQDYFGMQVQRRARLRDMDHDRQHDTVLVTDGLESAEGWQAFWRRPGDLGTGEVF